MAHTVVTTGGCGINHLLCRLSQIQFAQEYTRIDKWHLLLLENEKLVCSSKDNNKSRTSNACTIWCQLFLLPLKYCDIPFVGNEHDIQRPAGLPEAHSPRHFQSPLCVPVSYMFSCIHYALSRKEVSGAVGGLESAHSQSVCFADWYKNHSLNIL